MSILSGMKIDIHSHILPGIDDGAKTLEESVRLVSEMAGWGFERITCTPHITKKFRNTQDSIKEKFDILSNAVSHKGLDIELRMSAEYRLNPETWPEILSQGQLMPIEDQYILMEFPINDPTEMGELIPMEERQAGKRQRYRCGARWRRLPRSYGFGFL